MPSPTNIQLIGQEVAILWDDGLESYLGMERLRAASPSAEMRGELDLFGNVHGKAPARDFTGVTIVGWDRVGNYALRFDFSDGHSTGLYTYDYLRAMAPKT